MNTKQTFFFSILLMMSVNAIDYFDHVTCTDANFGLYGITNDSIYSLDGNTRITMQSDGNLVLYYRIDLFSNWLIQWQSYSSSISANSSRPVLFIQQDGNLVVYTFHGQGWHSNTWKGGQNSYTFVVNNGRYAYLLDNTQTVIWSTDDTAQSYPTYNILPTHYPTTPPTIDINNADCTFSHVAPIQIGVDNIIGNIEIRPIIEISFDLKIQESAVSCPANTWCHIFAINDRFPLIYTNPSNTVIAQFRLNPTTSKGSEATNVYSIISDGNWHNFYFKFSFTHRIFSIDNIEYENIHNGSFDHSYYFNTTHQISVVWANPTGHQYAHNGTIKNLCINSTFNPANNPSFTPSHNPSSTPTKLPTTIPTYIPTFTPSNNPSLTPINTPTISPVTHHPTYTSIPSVSPTILLTTLPPTIYRNGDGEIIESTEAIEATDPMIKIRHSRNTDHSTFWAIIITMLTLICICVVFLTLFIRKQIRKDKQVNNRKNESIAEMIHGSEFNGKGTKFTISNFKGNTTNIQRNKLFGTFNKDDTETDNIGTVTNSDINDGIIIDDNDDTPNGDNVITGQYNEYFIPEDDTPNTESTGESDHPVHLNSNNIKNDTPFGSYEQKKDVIGIDIGEWLMNTVRLPQYLEHFIEHGYLNMNVIVEQIKDKSMLNEIGIELKGHQVKIMAEIRKLRLGSESENFIAYKSVFENPTYEGDNQIIIENDENGMDNEDKIVNVNNIITPK
eukprot:166577_1